MFIEKLWNTNPELVENEIKKLFGVKEDRGERFYFVDCVKGRLFFVKKSDFVTRIGVNDFDVCTSYSGDNYGYSLASSVEWMKFMKNIFGEKYLEEFMLYRDNQFIEYIEKYKQYHGMQTNKVLAELGIAGMEQYNEKYIRMK